MLTGNVVSLFLGGIICAVVSFIFPEDYDFLSMRQIKVMDVAEDGDLGFAKVSQTLHSRCSCHYVAEDCDFGFAKVSHTLLSRCSCRHCRYYCLILHLYLYVVTSISRMLMGRNYALFWWPVSCSHILFTSTASFALSF